MGSAEPASPTIRLQGWGFKQSGISQGGEQELESKFNHRAKDSISQAYVVIPQ